MGPITRTAVGLAATATVTLWGATLVPGAGTVHPASPRRAGTTPAAVVGPTRPADAVARPRPLLVRHERAVRHVASVAAGSVGRAAPPDEAPSTARQETTPVAGGIVTVPTGAPTSADPSKFDFKGLCTEEWTGDWTGVSVCNVTWAHYDIETGELTATIVDTFTGTYAGDHSTGTLTFDETFAGNVISGSGALEGHIVASGGDPTFRCASGTVAMPVYFNPVFGYGGYSATWHHGCMTGSV